MIFKDNEIEELNRIEIYVDKREYSTDELWAIINKNDKNRINKDLYNKIWYEIYGPPCSVRWMPKEVRPKNIKKEDITECPRCKGKLKIMKDNKMEEYYKCENCRYASYIIKIETKDAFKVNDKVKLKGYKNEGKIVEIINNNECMVEFDDIKAMQALLCGTMFFEFLEKIEKGEAKPTHVEKRNISELEKVTD